LAQSTRSPATVRRWWPPSVNTELINQHLRFISEEAGQDAHVVLVIDQAGWHRSKRLAVPGNITLLPPYSPELNVIEKLWGFMRSHYLGNRAYRDYDHLFTTACEVCRLVDDSRIKSVCRVSWIERLH